MLLTFAKYNSNAFEFECDRIKVSAIPEKAERQREMESIDRCSIALNTHNNLSMIKVIEPNHRCALYSQRNEAECVLGYLTTHFLYNFGNSTLQRRRHRRHGIKKRTHPEQHSSKCLCSIELGTSELPNKRLVSFAQRVHLCTTRSEYALAGIVDPDRRARLMCSAGRVRTENRAAYTVHGHDSGPFDYSSVSAATQNRKRH